MIEARYDWAVMALAVAADGIDGAYARGVADAARFLSGRQAGDDFAPVYDRYLEMLPRLVMSRPFVDIPSHSVPSRYGVRTP